MTSKDSFQPKSNLLDQQISFPFIQQQFIQNNSSEQIKNKNLASDKLNQQKFYLFQTELNIRPNILEQPSKPSLKQKMIFKKTLLIITLFIAAVQILPISALKISHNKNTVSHQTSSKKGLSHLLQHQQSGQNVYDEQRYLVDLAQKQNSFKQKITQIQNDFAGINLLLNDTNLSTNQKNIKLSEALADERDALISAQSQLNIPYELKTCQCLNLTEQKKLDIKAELQKVKIKIQELQKSSLESNKHCQPHECPLMKQLNDDIQSMKNYQSIMQNTIDSKCCKVVKQMYKDNLAYLQNSQWHFGNTTQSQYQAKLLQMEQNNVKLEPCPSATPFANWEQNTCFACTTVKPLFNLGTRACEKDCTQSSKNDAYVLNMISHVCGYNKNCPQGQSYDETLKKCSTVQSYYNQSSCPPERPFWDPLSYSCQACPSQTPFFDVSFKKCRACSSGQTWNQNTRVCQSSQVCAQGKVYDSSKKQCVAKPTDTHSLCPPDRPYWNEKTFSCDACLAQKPFYDPVIKACRICTSQQTFNELSKQCVKKSQNTTCSAEEFYNNQTKACERKGTTSMCPPSTPFWDAANFKCLQCPNEKPSFNSVTRQCQPCAINNTWSNTYQACIQSCFIDEQWNGQYKKCVKKDKNCPQKYAFSYELNKCIEINCDPSKPQWNSTANMCQPCAAGTIYNYVTNNCEKDTRSGNISVCNQDRPLWNPDYLRCQACPQGRVWNSQSAVCQQKLTHNHHNSDTNTFRHLLTVHLNQDSENSRTEGQVYGDNQISYQHHLLFAGNI